MSASSTPLPLAAGPVFSAVTAPLPVQAPPGAALPEFETVPSGSFGSPGAPASKEGSGGEHSPPESRDHAQGSSEKSGDKAAKQGKQGKPGKSGKSDKPSDTDGKAVLSAKNVSKGSSSDGRSTSGRALKVVSTARRTTEMSGPGSEAQRSLATQLMLNRHLTLALLSLLTLVAPSLRNDRGTLLAGLLCNLVVLGVLGQLYLAKRGRVPSFLPWAEGAVFAAVVLAAPALLPYAVVISAGQLALGIVTYGYRNAALAAAATAAAYVLVISARDGAASMSTVAIFAAFIPGVWLIAGRMRRFEGEQRRQYHELLVGLDAVVWEGEPGGRKMTFMSSRSEDMFGIPAEQLVKSWASFVHPDDRERDEQALASLPATGSRFSSDYRLKDREGRTVHVRDTIRVERDLTGKPIRLRGVMVDVTRQQEAEALIRRQAQYDMLTGLPNRMTFNDELRRRLEEARDTTDGLALLLMDLNGFKEVNDTLGHAVGDQLLQAIAGRLSAYLPDRAMVARLGGDEFAVVLSPASARSAAALADTVAACLQPPITIDDMTIQAGASTGIALFPSDGDTPTALMRRADAAMYEAKQAGRAHVFATPDDDQANVRRLQLLGELRASIATGEFQLFHQPKIDLQTGRVVGTEGLIRWQHKQFGLLTPHEFVELSELSGLIQPLTRWIIEQGIAQARRWREEGFDLTVALNLSVRNFFDQGLPSFIAGLLADHDLPGESVVLEITEREVMADRALARSALAAFRSLGVKISVDDFGTGYSSLSQLQQLPIDEIKVDASFVAGMVTSPQDAVIVRSIVDLGHNLGLQVVAEGVEDLDQLRALRQLGCDRAQGYAISRPIPAEQFTEWLRERARGARPSVPKA